MPSDAALSLFALLYVHRRLRVFLHADDLEAERGLQLGVAHVGFLHAERGGSDETFVLGCLAGEVLPDGGDLGRRGEAGRGRTRGGRGGERRREKGGDGGGEGETVRGVREGFRGCEKVREKRDEDIYPRWRER